MDKLKHELIKSLDVPGLYVVSLITFTTIQQTLGVIAMVISIGYSAWKWTTELKKYRRENKNKKNIG